MKLRNKKTGKIDDILISAYGVSGDIALSRMNESFASGYEDIARYETLEQLNNEWEDYKPIEPLIKDEKIRKAVRAWAEADDLDNFRVQNQHFNDCKIIGYTAGINKASFIGFQTTIAHADSSKLYTIAELCGEEEE